MTDKLTHDIQLIIEWDSHGWDIFAPTTDESIGSAELMLNDDPNRARCPATLHIPINGKERPFITCDIPQRGNPEVSGWDK